MTTCRICAGPVEQRGPRRSITCSTACKRERDRRLKRARYRLKKARRRCPTCNGGAAPGRTQCPECLGIEAERRRRERMIRILQAIAIALGLAACEPWPPAAECVEMNIDECEAEGQRLVSCHLMLPTWCYEVAPNDLRCAPSESQCRSRLKRDTPTTTDKEHTTWATSQEPASTPPSPSSRPTAARPSSPTASGR